MQWVQQAVDVNFKKLFPVFIYSFVIFYCTVTAAQEESNPITVFAPQLTETGKLARGANPVTIIIPDSSGIQASSVTQLLNSTAGLRVNKTGGAGSRSMVSIRGSNYNQILICVDGIPVTDALYGEIDLDSILISSIKRIEIYKGITPLRFGKTGMSGVINIVTAGPEQKYSPADSFRNGEESNNSNSENRIKTAIGSFGTYHLSFKRISGNKKYSYLLFTAYDSCENDFDFLNDNGTPVINTGDDKTEKRKNSQYISGKAKLNGKYNFDSFSLALNNGFMYKKNGIPGINSNTALDSSFTSKTFDSSVFLDFNHFGAKNNKLNMKIHYSYREQLLSDPENEIMMTQKSETGTFHTAGSTLYFNSFIDKLNSIFDVSASYSRETFKKTTEDYSGNSIAYPAQKRDNYAGGIGNEFLLFDGKVSILPAFRITGTHDSFYTQRTVIDNNPEKDDDNHYLLHYSTSARLNIIDSRKTNFALFASFSQTGRHPSFMELFGNENGVLGNPELEDENAQNREAGISLTSTAVKILPEIKFNTLFFYNTIDDTILFIQNSQSTMLAQNIGKALIYGTEVSGEVLVKNRLKLSGEYTFQHTEDRSGIPYYRGNQLPGRPTHQFNGASRLIFKNSEFQYSIDVIGSNYLDRANSTYYYIDRRIYHNLLWEFRPFEYFCVTAEISNLLDKKSRDTIGYPLPGRAFYLTAEYLF